ncbi:monoheme cytochrome C [Allomuricauda sp. SCSIO 65647]|uniref:monoheme cytochrome C n=1 Tax=Allomuricauda sp. SCSIO 65647 TaxID=2908843 RepID=UPI001F167373|nr:monoheme cytochrome C [Muricauda sp. SCSIO 65647]UJH68761.1 monoheme cytochrome C [Muricauda sp. SCSIO 65647]
MGKRLKKQFGSLAKALLALGALVLLAIMFFFFIDTSDNLSSVTTSKEKIVEIPEEDFDKIENGIHVATGFVEDEGMRLVIQNCVGCHSAKLVTQNRLSAEGWQSTIKWMQETQNLWSLGANEEKIIEYLAKNYGPVSKGRRKNLINADWYELK